MQTVPNPELAAQIRKVSYSTHTQHVHMQFAAVLHVLTDLAVRLAVVHILCFVDVASVAVFWRYTLWSCYHRQCIGLLPAPTGAHSR